MTRAPGTPRPVRRILPLAFVALVAVSAFVPAHAAAGNTCATAIALSAVDARAGSLSSQESEWYKHDATGVAEYAFAVQNTNGYAVMIAVYDGCGGNLVCESILWHSDVHGDPVGRCVLTGTGTFYLRFYMAGYATPSYQLQAATVA